MRALVTGHMGFIGRHVKARLEADGWNVDGCDTAARTRVPNDARDVFRHSKQHYDLAVHCAAVVGGRAVIEGAPLAQAVNLELDSALFQWAERARPGRVIYFSSSAAYPKAIQQFAVPLAEDMINLDDARSPDELYGWAKLTGEILAARARRVGVPVTVLRPFSGYGEDQSTDYPFAAFAERARNREAPFTIWGSGLQVRDWIHVDDIVAAALQFAAAGLDGPFNMGWGQPVSMRELARAFTTVAGYDPQIAVNPAAPAGVSYRVCDPALFFAHYTPRVSLTEGIRRALEHSGVPA